MKKISVIYEDQDVVVFDKPSGVIVVPAPGKTGNVLTDLVNAQYGHQSIGRLHPCHRLDQMTSGAVIFAFGKKNQQAVMRSFHEGQVRKKYLAFMKGRLKERSGEIRESVKDHYQASFAKGARARTAVTLYQVVRCERGISVVEVVPMTGRTNQIRIHFARMGHPLLGERVYAFRRDFELDMKRLALHSHEVIFPHPVSGKEVRAVAPLPEDMQKFLEGLT